MSIITLSKSSQLAPSVSPPPDEAETLNCYEGLSVGSDGTTLGFSDEDKAGTIQPHDDALVVTLRIGGYDVRRVLVD